MRKLKNYAFKPFLKFFFTIHTYYVIFGVIVAFFLAQNLQTKVLTAQKTLLLECLSPACVNLFLIQVVPSNANLFRVTWIAVLWFVGWSCAPNWPLEECLSTKQSYLILQKINYNFKLTSLIYLQSYLANFFMLLGGAVENSDVHKNYIGKHFPSLIG